MNVNCIKINPNDNVVTLIKDVATMEELVGDNVPKGVVSLCAVPLGHKIAIGVIEAGEKVIKYGETIGYANTDISPGDHVHVQNIESGRGRGDLE